MTGDFIASLYCFETVNVKMRSCKNGLMKPFVYASRELLVVMDEEWLSKTKASRGGRRKSLASLMSAFLSSGGLREQGQFL